ncbi:MAG: hypothetical protein WBC44_05350, partial [Planctomycetaceae bacterium]
APLPRERGAVAKTRRTSRRRGGTTLTEVLMSLMIMGIGLVSVATLFPLSVLRSIEATQQTTATALRYGAEALIDGSGTEPVYDPTTGTVRVNPQQVNPLTPPATPSSLTGCATAAIALDPDGDHDPNRNDVDYMTATHAIGFNRLNHREGFYVVDPLGYWRLRQQGELHPVASIFGDWTAVGDAPTYPLPGGGGSVTWYTNRFSLNVPDHSSDPQGDPVAFPHAYLRPLFGFTGTPESFTDAAPSAHIEENAKRAEFAVGLPDSFITVADGRMSEGAVTVTATGIDFPSAGGATGDFSMFMAGGAPDVVMLERGQVTIFSADGRRSIVRELETDVVTTWASASGDIPAGRLQFKSPLPASFLAAGVDRVLVEAVEDRYNWLLTVRRQARSSLIDVVVFFRRAFGRDDEHVYLVTQNFASLAAFNQRKLEQKEYFVAWNSTTEPKPEFKEGDWMFDPVNFRWHKIGQIVGEQPIDPSIWTADVQNALGFPAGTGYAANMKIVFRLEGAQVADEPVRRGIFMQGVVDVYPIEPKSPGNFD